MTGRRVGIWAAALLLVAAAPGAAADRCGDADGNGAVTVSDGVQTLRAAAALASSCTPARCDLDGGGTVTVSDGVNVLRSAAELSVVLACPGDGGPTCTAATVTLALTVSAPLGAGDLDLVYPSTVALPGSGDAAAERVTILTEGSLASDGQPNDHDDRVHFTLVSLEGIASGPLLAVRFDCAGAVPEAADFGCALTGTAPDGVTPVDAACTVEVATE